MSDLTSVKVSEEEADLLANASDRVATLERHLGALRVEYITAEARLISALTKAYEEHDALLAAIGRRHVADKPGRWSYDPREKSLTSAGNT